MRGLSGIRQRVIILSTVLIIISLLLIWRSAYLGLGDENRNRTNLVLMTRTPLSLSKLASQTKLIDDVSRHIEDYRLKDITKMLSDTADMASNASRELQAQSDAWLKIKESATIDARAYQDLQQSLATTNQLQAQEIGRLRNVLEKAEKPSPFYSALSLIATFAAGIFTSIIADFIKKKFRSRFAYAIKRIRGRFYGSRAT